MKNQHIFISLAGGIILFLLFGGGFVLWFGGLGQLIAYNNGESVYIVHKTLNLGSCEAGTKTVAVFRMTNLSSKEVSVVGERSSCNCAFSEKIPITVQPGKTIDLKINIQLPKHDTAYDQSITFMVAEPNRLAMHPVRVTATIPNPLPQPIESENIETNE